MEAKPLIPHDPVLPSCTFFRGSRLWSITPDGGRMVFVGRRFTKHIVLGILCSPIVFLLTRYFHTDVTLSFMLTLFPLLYGGAFCVARWLIRNIPQVVFDRDQQTIEIDRRVTPLAQVRAVQVLDRIISRRSRHRERRVVQVNLVLDHGPRVTRIHLDESASENQMFHNARQISKFASVPIVEHFLPWESVRSTYEWSPWMKIVLPGWIGLAGVLMIIGIINLNQRFDKLPFGSTAFLVILSAFQIIFLCSFMWAQKRHKQMAFLRCLARRVSEQGEPIPSQDDAARVAEVDQREPPA